jgi:Ca2+:H+ antiporter
MTAPPALPPNRSRSFPRRELPLLFSLGTTGLFLIFGSTWLADLSRPGWFAFILSWLFAAILFSAVGVVHHAESLALKLGEPIGTLILTLAVTGIEVTCWPSS